MILLYRILIHLKTSHNPQCHLRYNLFHLVSFISCLLLFSFFFSCLLIRMALPFFQTSAMGEFHSSDFVIHYHTVHLGHLTLHHVLVLLMSVFVQHALGIRGNHLLSKELLFKREGCLLVGCGPHHEGSRLHTMKEILSEHVQHVILTTMHKEMLFQRHG